MPSKIIWSPTAIHDLEDIHAHISRNSVGYANSMIGRIVDAVERLSLFPNMGPRFQQDERSTHRQLVIQPYIVVYDVKSERVDVLAIVHGARNLGALFRSRGIE